MCVCVRVCVHVFARPLQVFLLLLLLVLQLSRPHMQFDHLRIHLAKLQSEHFQVTQSPLTEAAASTFWSSCSGCAIIRRNDRLQTELSREKNKNKVQLHLLLVFGDKICETFTRCLKHSHQVTVTPLTSGFTG